ncbi:MAG: threonylcarbamoyl-AMP synthase [Coleofasciculaceae cyanobacterium SM2_3_26]|nr:threonylcarbamoyl-AMP synthase [Coleofasciculaceae cyanobacterium SM2_3_26]
MATLYTVHPEDPQPRRIEQIVEQLRDGAVMLYPTDTVYAIGCDINSKSAVERVRSIKQLSNTKPLTFLCSSLSNIATYAYVTDSAYRTLRRLVPGTYTFILPATKLVPKLVMDPKRKTTGIRVPDRPICQALLQTLGNPIISTSARIPADGGDMEDAPEYPGRAELFDRLENLVDVIIDDELEASGDVSTILDLSGEAPEIIRRGQGWEAVAELL